MDLVNDWILTTQATLTTLTTLATQEFKISSQSDLTQLNEAMSADEDAVICHELKLGGLNLRQGLGAWGSQAFWMIEILMLFIISNNLKQLFI